MRALLSVYDKSDLVPFARGLVDLGWELVSSGGTARVLAESEVPVTDVADLTGYPAIMGHRVVTLHPKVHGGVLADRNDPDHLMDMEAYGIELIDLVVGNLYPFRDNPSIDLIDIGGPAIVRAAAKNYENVGVVVDPSEYDGVLAELRADGELSLATRRRLAHEAFRHTAAYDAAIVRWLDSEDAPGAEVVDEPTEDDAEALPEELTITLQRRAVLRYGENPHQAGARYALTHGHGWWDTVRQHGGKEMSYLNVYDAEAAWRLVHSLGDDPAAVVVKHANPCGVALADDITTAYQRAHACDPVSAFGGIVALNRPVTPALAEALAPVFTEVLIAPGFEGDSLMTLLEKRNLRVLEAEPPGAPGLVVRTIDGGALVQTPDTVTVDREQWQVVTQAAPDDAQWADIELAWRVVAAVGSNAIVLVKDRQAVGIGAGQQNRRDAGRLAGEKADGRAAGGVYASDAFFPFPDGLEGAVAAGATAVVQPGGSVRDEEVVAAADEAGLAMVLTGERHFKH